MQTETSQTDFLFFVVFGRFLFLLCYMFFSYFSFFIICISFFSFFDICIFFFSDLFFLLVKLLRGRAEYAVDLAACHDFVLIFTFFI